MDVTAKIAPRSIYAVTGLYQFGVRDQSSQAPHGYHGWVGFIRYNSFPGCILAGARGLAFEFFCFYLSFFFPDEIINSETIVFIAIVIKD
ncbi:hypothetical protein I3843_03G049900 [Carya illinoinensis]|nr:hypothetical protein I3843_03G049900 [Carya illinoinensis]